ncbi:molybdopterin oxidoreductase [Clostridiales bacterium PH28_bin88]|nr:molybdopterin oxidoreductase [Clostridiales bacterium PH28_bin88]
MKKGNFLLGLALVLLLVSLLGWGYQLKSGLIVTNLRNPFSWGLYIATFAFFVGIAAGGLIVSSSVYVFNIQQLKPFTRIASLSAFASVLGAAVMILPDMGRVDRLYHLILHPNFRSPLIWDVIVITTYMILTFFSVYFQLLPDWKKEGRGFLNGWTKKLPASEVERVAGVWSRRIAMVGLPVAILIHTVTAWIFATQASRGWWNSAMLAPDFISKAVASGTALVLVISLLVAGKERFSQYQGAFKTMALIVAGALVVHFFFTASELLTRWWWAVPGELEPLSLTLERYGVTYLVEVGSLAFTMIYFFTARGRRSMHSLVLGSAVLFIGVFANRFLLMPAAYNVFPLNLTLPGTGVERWNYPIAIGEFREGMPVFTGFWPYVPSMVEVMVTLLPFALVLLVISLMLRSYDFLPPKRLLR